MATVYLARDLRHDRDVALKVLRPELAALLGGERFLREIRVTAQLQNPHILPLLDSGEVDGLLYYVMPYVAGESLRDRLRRELQLPVDDALRLAREVAEALSAAHGQGVIHRDVKPENILLSGGHALLADFGIARALDDAGERITETGLAVGTAAYMSPEQASGERRLDGRSDIYSLGCVLYEMLAGEPPFTGPTARAIMVKRLTDPVPQIGRLRPISAAVQAVIARALAVTPADRYSSAIQFAEALAGAPTAAPAPAGSAPGAKRRPIRLWLGAVAALVLVAVGLGVREIRRNDGPSLRSDVIAVAPFRVSSGDSSLSYLREGMVDLLAAKLTGEGGPLAADPRAVLSAWRGAASGSDRDLTEARALQLAARLGAGQLLLGDLVAPEHRLVVSARVLAVPDGAVKAHATVEGPADSLTTILDRLTTKLLTLSANEGGQRLSALTSASLPAVQHYLAGQALYRRGLYDQAIGRFDAALQVDSGFALAALGFLASAVRLPENETSSRAERLWATGRNRLNARDDAFLTVLLGMTYSDSIPYSRRLRDAERFVSIAPDRAEAYVALSDMYMDFGEMLGVPDAPARAVAACESALALDSTFLPAVENLTVLAARAGDTATVRRNRDRYRAIAPNQEVWPWIAWRMAVALDDRRALDSIRSQYPTMYVMNLMGIGQMAQYDGVSVQDAGMAQQAWLKRESRRSYRVTALAEVGAWALNGGRPAEARKIREEQEQEPEQARATLARMNQIIDALYWDGDSVAAARAVTQLAALPDSQTEGRPPPIHLCALEQWRLAHGERSTVGRSIGRLRGATARPELARMTSAAHGCAILLEAIVASLEQRSDRVARIARLDSLMLTGPAYRAYDLSWNLVLARLKEAQGDLPGALAATRRRLYFYAEPQFLSTYLREEGRLAGLTGDRVGAIRAYRHYLTLRADPEPALRSQVQWVRAALTKLLGEPGRS